MGISLFEGLIVVTAVLVLLQLLILLRQQSRLNEIEQGDKKRAEDNAQLMERLSANDTKMDRTQDLMLTQTKESQKLLLDQQSELKQYLQDKIADLRHMLQQLTTEQYSKLEQQLNSHQSAQHKEYEGFKEHVTAKLVEQKEQIAKNHLESTQQLTESLNKTNQSTREELAKSLDKNAELISKRMNELTQATDNKLKEIGGQVEKRLSEGFEKTTQTFQDILKRLALIDDAQKKITELSTNVVSLQEVLADKRSRGAFGEVQLAGLIRNVLPEQHFSLQHKLSNDKIADCVLFLPEPTGTVVIDSKFPLESFRKMMDNELGDADRKTAERQFRQDVKKHINDIADKYIIEKETSDGALMFVPAEAIFAEIHAHQPELVEEAYRKRVWLASPTTLMAILTTARSVIKDEATRKQVHIIQDHLVKLGADFGRFKERFNKLATHIDQAANDVKQIHTSANKISSRFVQIERVDIEESSIDLIDE